jgi:hypothetical protein
MMEQRSQMLKQMQLSKNEREREVCGQAPDTPGSPRTQTPYVQEQVGGACVKGVVSTVCSPCTHVESEWP